jgi:hypothetical protein
MTAQLIQEHQKLNIENTEAFLIQTSDTGIFCHSGDESENDEPESGDNDVSNLKFITSFYSFVFNNKYPLSLLFFP